MKMNFFGKVTLTGACVVGLALGCSSESDSGTTSATTATSTATTSTAVTTSSATGGGAGAGGDMTTGAGGSAASSCAMGIDTPCEQCGFAKCKTEAQACADNSTCDASGEPTGGCLALVSCAAVTCQGDIACIASMCTKELQSAGGFAGAGTAAAQSLGTCVQNNCSNECLPGAGGSN